MLLFTFQINTDSGGLRGKPELLTSYWEGICFAKCTKLLAGLNPSVDRKEINTKIEMLHGITCVLFSRMTMGHSRITDRLEYRNGMNHAL